MSQRIYTDRSRYLEFQHCPRKRYLAYHFGGMGIEPKRRSWHLALGSAVHEGLAALLTAAMEGVATLENARQNETFAVEVALRAYDRETSHGLAMDRDETAQVTADPGGASLTQLLQASLDDEFASPVAPLVIPGGLAVAPESQSSYTLRELRALTEAMVRAYARRRLPVLLAEFDVLEVEREGEWKVAEMETFDLPHQWSKGIPHPRCSNCGVYADAPGAADSTCSVNRSVSELWFASRPDALLLHRATQTLHIMSFKTTGTWDGRKERDAGRDVQGLSEGVEVERRLESWWNTVKEVEQDGQGFEEPKSAIVAYLSSLSAPPRIHAIRYEYLLKGARKQEDRGPLTGLWTQRTPLLRGYFDEKSGEWAHSWTWQQEDELGTTVKRTLTWNRWKGRPAWEDRIDQPGGVTHWIDMLDRGVIQPGAGDVLAEQFPAPITVYRSDDDLRDWLEQVESQEVGVARAVAAVQDRSDLNRLFPQHRRSCSYPSDCQFVPVCFGPADAKEDPVGTGLYQIRVPNHPQEGEQHVNTN